MANALVGGLKDLLRGFSQAPYGFHRCPEINFLPVWMVKLDKLRVLAKDLDIDLLVALLKEAAPQSFRLDSV